MRKKEPAPEKLKKIEEIEAKIEQKELETKSETEKSPSR